MAEKKISKRRSVIVAAIALIAIVAVAGGVYYFYSTQPQEKTELIVGVSLPITGSMALNSEERKMGLSIWLDDVNSRGGILGRLVRIIYYDDEGKVEKIPSNLERLITVDHAEIVFGGISTGLAYATLSIAEKYKMPLIHGAFSTKVYGAGYEYCFCVSPGLTADMAYGFMEMLSKVATDRPKTIGILGRADAWGIEISEFAKFYAADLGFKVTYTETFPAGTSDFTPMLLKAKAANPDAFMMISYDPDGAVCTRQMREVDWSPKAYFMDTGPQLPAWRTTLGADGDYVCDSLLWTPNAPEARYPGTADFNSKFLAKYGREAATQASNSYTTAQIMEQAVIKAGSTDGEKVRAALLNTNFTTLRGTYRFGPRMVNTTFGQVECKYVNLDFRYGLFQIQNRTIVPIYPPEIIDAYPDKGQLIYPIPTWSDR